MEEQEELKEGGHSGTQLANVPEMKPASKVNRPVIPAQEEVSPGPGPCPTGGEMTPRFIYVLGSIHARFPTLDVEKEFAQAVREGKTANLTDQQVLSGIVSQEENLYLAREICWVFTVEGIDTYILVPRTDKELSQLVEAIKPVKGVDVDVVTGVRGPIASPEMCNGLQVPIVICDRIYSFDIEAFINAIPKPEGMKDEPFRQAARELFTRIQQLTDNTGAMDEHRAVNYVALRYPAIYAHTMQMFAVNQSLTSVDVRTSRLSNTRRIVDVILSYINRNTDVIEKYFIRVDVSGKWPFLVTKLSPFYDR